MQKWPLCVEFMIKQHSKYSLLTDLKNFFQEASGQYHIEMVFLYGSWASGYPKEESDIDLGILFSREVAGSALIHSLVTDISYKLTLELKKEVNIVNINPDFDHPMLYYNVINLGIPVYIKDQDRFISLRLDTLYQMEDFQLFGIRWQRDIARNILKEVGNG